MLGNRLHQPAFAYDLGRQGLDAHAIDFFRSQVLHEGVETLILRNDLEHSFRILFGKFPDVIRDAEIQRVLPGPFDADHPRLGPQFCMDSTISVESLFCFSPTKRKTIWMPEWSGRACTVRFSKSRKV